MAIAAIGIIIANNSVENFKGLVAENFAREDLSVYGFQMGAPVVNGELNVAAFIIFCIGAATEQMIAAIIRATPTQWNTSKIFVMTLPSVLSFFIALILQIKNVFWLNDEYYNTKIYVCQYVFNVCR